MNKDFLKYEVKYEVKNPSTFSLPCSMFRVHMCRDLPENLHRQTAFSSANFADEREKVLLPSAGLMNANSNQPSSAMKTDSVGRVETPFFVHG